MAVIGSDYERLKNICPADIEIICCNSDNSNIVSGPTESVQEFMKKLQVELLSISYVDRKLCIIIFKISTFEFQNILPYLHMLNLYFTIRLIIFT